MHGNSIKNQNYFLCFSLFKCAYKFQEQFSKPCKIISSEILQYFQTYFSRKIIKGGSFPLRNSHMLRPLCCSSQNLQYFSKLSSGLSDQLSLCLLDHDQNLFCHNNCICGLIVKKSASHSLFHLYAMIN